MSGSLSVLLMRSPALKRLLNTPGWPDIVKKHMAAVAAAPQPVAATAASLAPKAPSAPKARQPVVAPAAAIASSLVSAPHVSKGRHKQIPEEKTLAAYVAQKQPAEERRIARPLPVALAAPTAAAVAPPVPTAEVAPFPKMTHQQASQFVQDMVDRCYPR